MSQTQPSIEISLTDFVDFVLNSGVAQQKKVRDIKARHAYDPTNDHYGQIRRGIVRMHQYNDPVQRLQEICDNAHKRKKATYQAVATGYERFLGSRVAIWFQPMKRLWTHPQSGLSVRVNPEVGLRIDGTPHVLKLHFCKQPLQRDRVLGIVQLMEQTLQPYHTTDTVFGLLDVPNSVLWTTVHCKDDLMPSIRSFATAFVQLYNEL